MNQQSKLVIINIFNYSFLGKELITGETIKQFA